MTHDTNQRMRRLEAGCRLILVLWIVVLTLAGMIEIPVAFVRIAASYLPLATVFDLALNGPAMVLGILGSMNLAVLLGISLLTLVRLSDGTNAQEHGQ
jgi:hypothetical protein